MICTCPLHLIKSLTKSDFSSNPVIAKPKFEIEFIWNVIGRLNMFPFSSECVQTRRFVKWIHEHVSHNWIVGSLLSPSLWPYHLAVCCSTNQSIQSMKLWKFVWNCHADPIKHNSIHTQTHEIPHTHTHTYRWTKQRMEIARHKIIHHSMIISRWSLSSPFSRDKSITK